jgi:hypothetical protein
MRNRSTGIIGLGNPPSWSGFSAPFFDLGSVRSRLLGRTVQPSVEPRVNLLRGSPQPRPAALSKRPYCCGSRDCLPDGVPRSEVWIALVWVCGVKPEHNRATMLALIQINKKQQPSCTSPRVRATNETSCHIGVYYNQISPKTSPPPGYIPVNNSLPRSGPYITTFPRFPSAHNPPDHILPFTHMRVLGYIAPAS